MKRFRKAMLAVLLTTSALTACGQADGKPKGGIKVDPFDPEFFNVSEEETGIHVTMVGISPVMKLEIKNDFPYDDPLSRLQYKVEPEYFENGETVTIRVTEDTESALKKANEKYYISNTETTMTFDDGNEWIMSYDQISEENRQIIRGFMDKYETILSDVHNPDNYIAQENWTSSFSVIDFKYLDPILAVPQQKEKDDLFEDLRWGSVNDLYLPYEITYDTGFTKTADYDPIRTEYGFLTFHNLVIVSDGSIPALTEERLAEDRYRNGSSRLYDSYEDIVESRIHGFDTIIIDLDTLK